MNRFELWLANLPGTNANPLVSGYCPVGLLLFLCHERLLTAASSKSHRFDYGFSLLFLRFRSLLRFLSA